MDAALNNLINGAALVSDCLRLFVDGSSVSHLQESVLGNFLACLLFIISLNATPVESDFFVSHLCLDPIIFLDLKLETLEICM